MLTAAFHSDEATSCTVFPVRAQTLSSLSPADTSLGVHHLGSGKSSLIHAIAGELALDIYVVSLSSSWINDATLTALMGRVPAVSGYLCRDRRSALTVM